MITDQPGAYTIKLSRSLPLGIRSTAAPVRGCNVTITDDLENMIRLKETNDGTYVTDSAMFRGETGRSYTLHIKTNSGIKSRNYESFPVEMKPVPPIDSIYWGKIEIAGNEMWDQNPEGCQVYLDTHDPTNQCNYYRWEYTDTWEFRLPYDVQNNTCWTSSASDEINIKSTASLSEPRIIKYPLSFISNNSDRLTVKCSVLVNQYSINEDEYIYWDKLRNMSQQVGGLYDMIPSAIPSNVYCINFPDEKVFGYFSVSAKKSRRIFIKDHFYGQANLYSYDACIADTVDYNAYIPNLGSTVWVLIDHWPSYKVITYTRGCADCTTRGTTKIPSYWTDDK